MKLDHPRKSWAWPFLRCCGEVMRALDLDVNAPDSNLTLTTYWMCLISSLLVASTPGSDCERDYVSVEKLLLLWAIVNETFCLPLHTERYSARSTAFINCSNIVKRNKVSPRLGTLLKRPIYDVRGNDWKHAKRSLRSIITSCKFRSIALGPYCNRYKDSLSYSVPNIGSSVMTCSVLRDVTGRLVAVKSTCYANLVNSEKSRLWNDIPSRYNHVQDKIQVC